MRSVNRLLFPSDGKPADGESRPVVSLSPLVQPSRHPCAQSCLTLEYINFYDKTRLMLVTLTWKQKSDKNIEKNIKIESIIKNIIKQ